MVSGSGCRFSIVRLRVIRVTDSIVLVCAVLASLASGVLIAYGVCLGLFRLFAIHAQQAYAKAAMPVAAVVQAVEG
jgi:hypothetical protein